MDELQGFFSVIKKTCTLHKENFRTSNSLHLYGSHSALPLLCFPCVLGRRTFKAASLFSVAAGPEETDVASWLALFLSNSLPLANNFF
jgi:hypothetical protein